MKAVRFLSSLGTEVECPLLAQAAPPALVKRTRWTCVHTKCEQH